VKIDWMRVQMMMGLLAVTSWIGFGCGDGSAQSTPNCGINEIVITGTVDGLDIDERLDLSGHLWTNKLGDNLGTGKAQSAAGAFVVDVAFNKLVSVGETAAARGEVDLSSTGGIKVGNCEDAGFPSTITSRADGFDVVLEDLRAAPYCESASVVGTLSVCVGWD
jgi:hypothetical protein